MLVGTYWSSGRIDLPTDEEGSQCIMESKTNSRPSKNNWNTYKKLIRPKGLKKNSPGMRKKVHVKQIISRQYENTNCVIKIKLNESESKS